MPKLMDRLTLQLDANFWPGHSYMRPKAIPERPTHLQLLCALNEMNTGGYGVTQSGGMYGRRGLEESEYIWFQITKAYVDGWLDGTENAEQSEFVEAMRVEKERVAALII
jgi:hypothetical protein